MNNTTVKDLKADIAIKAKHGIDFIIAAGIIWLLISYIWTLPFSAYNRSILTFIAGSLMLPIAYLISRLIGTQWKMNDNPLSSLGLWLNVAQLFYFPFLVFILIEDANFFIMTYAIITGAHLAPFAWFYDETRYAIIAGVISIGSLLLGLYLPNSYMFLIPSCMTVILGIFAGWIFKSYKDKAKFFNVEQDFV